MVNGTTSGARKQGRLWNESGRRPEQGRRPVPERPERPVNHLTSIILRVVTVTPSARRQK